jgi:histidinol-phosphatase (PHP family)
MGPADQVYRELGLDYIIGSVHYIFPPGGGEPFTVDGPKDEFERDLRVHFGGDRETLAAVYWETAAEMIRSGGFDILGHLDLVKKNNPGGGWFSAAIIPLVAGSGCVVEVNTGGMNRGLLDEPYPSPRILSLLQEAAAPVIITADAHSAAHLDGHYREAGEVLLKTGYRRVSVFEGRRAGKPVWKSEQI